jgi:hypothetical protein
MLQEIKLKLINEKFQIGLVNWREVYIFFPENSVIKFIDPGSDTVNSLVKFLQFRK